jgi:hypothetical protein
LGAVPQDTAPTQAGSRLTGGLVVEGAGDGAVLVGAAVAADGGVAGVAGSLAWLVRQPVRATLVSSRAVAMVRMGRMVLISLSGSGADRSAGGQLESWPASGTSYGMYCSAIFTTCPWWTVIQNGGLWWVACRRTASLQRGTRMSLVALPV